MIEVPNSDQNQALSIFLSIHRFAQAGELQGMRDWLKAELARLDKANRRDLEPAVFHQRQGACQVIEKLLEIAETAGDKADQIRANQRNKGAQP